MKLDFIPKNKISFISIRIIYDKTISYQFGINQLSISIKNNNK